MLGWNHPGFAGSSVSKKYKCTKKMYFLTSCGHLIRSAYIDMSIIS